MDSTNQRSCSTVFTTEKNLNTSGHLAVQTMLFEGQLHFPKKHFYHISLHYKVPPECMLSHCSCVRLFVTLWTVACQAPFSMGFSRQECWSGLPCPPPENLPHPGIKSESPTLQADSLPLSQQGNSKFCLNTC